MIGKVFLSKSITIVLIIALIIGIGGLNGIAVEDEPVFEAGSEINDGVIQEEILEEEIAEEEILEEVKEEILIEDSIIPEVIDSESSEEDTENLVVPLSDMVLLDSSIIEVDSADNLKQALTGIKDGNTIKLTKNIDYDEGIEIEGINITFDVGSYTLNVENKRETTIGLIVQNNAHVTLVGSGEFNVTGISAGVFMTNNSSATVTNVTALGESDQSDGAKVSNRSQLTIEGDVISIAGAKNIGVSAYSGGNVTVDGDVQGGYQGVYVNDLESEITVEGDVTAITNPGYAAFAYGGKISISGNATGSHAVYTYSGEITIGSNVEGIMYGVNSSGKGDPYAIKVEGDVIATDSNGVGAIISDTGNIIINGSITAANYIQLLYTNVNKEDGVLDDKKPGYIKYSDEKNRTVWVKDKQDSPVAKIGTTTYTSLDDALDDVKTGETIELLKSIDYDKGIEIDGKKIIFNLGSYNLNVVNTSGTGLKVLYGGEVALKGTGEFNVTGAGYGVYVDSGGDKSPTKAMVTSATVISMVADKFYGAYAFNIGSEIVVLKDVEATGNKGVGVRAYEGGAITVNGNVEASKTGAVAEGDLGVSVITIKGNVISTANESDVYTTPHGVYVQRSGVVTVGGNVLARGNGSIGVQVYGIGEIKVTGNVEGKKLGAGAKEGSIEIGGDVIGSNKGDSTGAFTESGGHIIIDGNAIGGSYGAIARPGNITIKKDAIGQDNGVYAQGINSIITVYGSVFATEDDAAYAYDNAKIIIKGDAISVNPSGGYSGYGAFASNSSTIEVECDVKGLGGAFADGNSKINIGGNAICTANAVSDVASVVAVSNSSVILWGNTSGGQYGAKSLHGGNIIIEGVINQIGYIKLDDVVKGKINADSIAGGYSIYSDSNNNIVRVKIAKKSYTVIFNSQEGSVVANQIITDGGKVANPIAPSRSGYAFNGWFKERECTTQWNFDTDTITADITLYAKWIEGETNPPTVPIITTNLPTSKSVTKGETVTFKVNANVNDGGTLSYQWYKDGVAIVGSNVDTLTITNTSSSNSGRYMVIITNTIDGITSLVKSTICTLKVNTTGGDGGSGGGGGTNENPPVKKDKDKKDEETKKPEDNVNGIITLDIDDGINENTLVPYFINENSDEIVKFSAIYGNKMHLIGNGDTDYLLKDNMKYFTDISNHWAKDDIDFVTARELFNSIGNSEFSPNSSMTRALAVTVLGKLWEVDIKEFKTTRFIDVEVDNYYAPYVEWAAENGIIKGISNNQFAPNRFITREEFAVIFVNFINFSNIRLNVDDVIAPIFEDYGLISDWAKDSVRNLQNSGIISGKPDNIFAPKGIVTKAEVAAILRRFVISIVK